MKNNKENKIEYARYMVETMKKSFNENRHYAWMDKTLIDNSRVTYISVGYNEEYDRLEVIGNYEFSNGFVEKVKIGQYNVTEGYGVIYMGNKEKEYVKLHYFQQALIKYWEQEMDKYGDMMSFGLYDMKKYVEQLKYLKSNTEEIVNLPLDEKYAIQLKISPNHTTTIKIFKEIFEKDEEYVDAYDVLADRFNPMYHLGVVMYNKFEELVTATVNGEVDIADMDEICTEMYRTVGYDEFEGFDIKIKILDYKLNKKSPNYEWFMKESEWTGLMTVVDMEKIYAFEDAGLKVELYEDVEEVLVWDVAEQLEGQVSLDEINYEITLSEDEVLPVGTKVEYKRIIKYRFDEEKKEMIRVTETFTGEITKIKEEVGKGMYTEKDFNDNVSYSVYCDEIIGWEKPVEKEEEVKELQRVEYKKSDVTKAMKKLGDYLKSEVRTDEEIYDKIFDMFPSACEIDIREEDVDSISFLAGVEYVGVKPTKASMLEVNEYFARVDRMYGLMFNIYIEKDKILMSADVMLDYVDKWGYAYNTDFVIKEMEIPTENNIQKREIVDEINLNLEPKVEKKKGFEVRIVDIETGTPVEIVKNIDNINIAESIERGMLINLNRDNYYTEIIDLSQSKIPIVEIVKKEKPAEVVRGSYTDCVECGSENFIENSKEGFICHECGEKNTRLIEITEDVTVESLLKLADDLGLPSLDEEVSPEPTAEDVREWQGIEIENKYSKELFDKYGLANYLVKETGILCIDTGSMMYKKINGEPTKTRVDRFLAENKEYEMKLFNDKHVAIPHYIIYKKENEEDEKYNSFNGKEIK